MLRFIKPEFLEEISESCEIEEAWKFPKRKWFVSLLFGISADSYVTLSWMLSSTNRKAHRIPEILFVCGRTPDLACIWFICWELSWWSWMVSRRVVFLTLSKTHKKVTLLNQPTWFCCVAHLLEDEYSFTTCCALPSAVVSAVEWMGIERLCWIWFHTSSIVHWISIITVNVVLEGWYCIQQ